MGIMDDYFRNHLLMNRWVGTLICTKLINYVIQRDEKLGFAFSVELTGLLITHTSDEEGM